MTWLCTQCGHMLDTPMHEFGCRDSSVTIEFTMSEARAICGGAQFGLPRDLDSAVTKIREALKDGNR